MSEFFTPDEKLVIRDFLAAEALKGWHLRPDEATEEMVSRCGAFGIASKRLTYRAMLACPSAVSKWDE